MPVLALQSRSASVLLDSRILANHAAKTQQNWASEFISKQAVLPYLAVVLAANGLNRHQKSRLCFWVFELP